MTIEEEKTEFTFQELNPAAQQRAIEQYAESLWGDWYEHVYADWETRLKNEGFHEPRIEFSGFWSQGDGASFKAWFYFTGAEAEKWLKPEDRDLLIAKRVEWKMDGHDPGDLILDGGIQRSGRYSHHMTMEVAGIRPMFYHENRPVVDFAEGFAGYVFDSILEHARGLAQEIYQDLEKEYEYLTGEEHVAEMSNANDWQYSKKGNLL
jgi:hypothetical protein